MFQDFGVDHNVIQVENVVDLKIEANFLNVPEVIQEIKRVDRFRTLDSLVWLVVNTIDKINYGEVFRFRSEVPFIF